MCNFKLLLPTVLLVVSVSVLQATTIHVPADSTTIQAGINGAVNGDTVLVANGTYTGDGNRDIDYGGRAIVVMSENGPEVTIIDCQGSYSFPHRGFHFHSGEDSTSVLQGFTIQNGYSAGHGGGMHIEDSSPTVTNCTFSGNTTPNAGGGMGNFTSSPTVTNCTFSENSAGAEGGGMSNWSSNPTVTNCTFSENFTSQWSGGGMSNSTNSSPTVTNCTFSGNTSTYNGGGMYNANSSPTVTKCTFSENSSNMRGGGMYNSYSDLTVTNCTFSGNTSTNYGGGMYSANSSLTVTKCTFSGNHGTYGGGMYNDDSSPTVTNCTFSGNSSNTSGGGMYSANSSSPTVTNCTFSENSSNMSGGGMYNSYSDPTVTNCILWGDIPDELYNYNSYPVVTYSDVEGGWTGVGNIDEDPMFVLADKDDYRLFWESPCIDTGDPTLFDPDGTRSDMGAHFFNQDDYMTLYLTPDATEVLPGDELGVTYTAINRWDSPEAFWLLSQVLLSGGSSLNVLGPDPYTLPANYTAQVHFTHPVPNITPIGMYEYRSLMGMPPGTLYDEDSFKFTVVE